MIFELLHSPHPEGYGEALLPLELCKTQMRIDGDEDDDLIEALRDAAIEFVERYCSLRLLESPGQVWRADGFPPSNLRALVLGMGPVKSIDDVRWRSAAGSDVSGAPASFRVSPSGDLLPAIGGRWPGDVGGAVQITFTAGFPEGAAPSTLLTAARMFLAHLYKNREAVTDRGTEAEVPLGVQTLCDLNRRILI